MERSSRALQRQNDRTHVQTGHASSAEAGAITRLSNLPVCSVISSYRHESKSTAVVNESPSAQLILRDGASLAVLAVTLMVTLTALQGTALQIADLWLITPFQHADRKLASITASSQRTRIKRPHASPASFCCTLKLTTACFANLSRLSTPSHLQLQILLFSPVWLHPKRVPRARPLLQPRRQRPAPVRHLHIRTGLVRRRQSL